MEEEEGEDDIEKREKGTRRREGGGGEGGRPDIGSRPGSELEGEVGEERGGHGAADRTNWATSSRIEEVVDEDEEHNEEKKYRK